MVRGWGTIGTPGAPAAETPSYLGWPCRGAGACRSPAHVRFQLAELSREGLTHDCDVGGSGHYIVVGRTGEGRKECERSGLRCGTGMWSSVLLILVVLVAAGFLGSEARLPDGLATVLAWISWVASETRGGRCMRRLMRWQKSQGLKVLQVLRCVG